MSAEQGALEGAVGSLAGVATALGVGGPQARRLMDAAAFTRGFDPAAVTAGIPSRRPSVGTLLTGLSEISSVVSALIDVAGAVPSGALSGASEERSEQDRRAADAERSVCSCASAMGTVQSGAVAAVESVVAGAVALCGGLGGAGVLAPPVLEAAREIIRTALSVVSGILTGRNELLRQCMGVLEKTVAPAAVPGRCDVPLSVAPPPPPPPPVIPPVGPPVPPPVVPDVPPPGGSDCPPPAPTPPPPPATPPVGPPVPPPVVPDAPPPVVPDAPPPGGSECPPPAPTPPPPPGGADCPPPAAPTPPPDGACCHGTATGTSCCCVTPAPSATASPAPSSAVPTVSSTASSVVSSAVSSGVDVVDSALHHATGTVHGGAADARIVEGSVGTLPGSGTAPAGVTGFPGGVDGAGPGAQPQFHEPQSGEPQSGEPQFREAGFVQTGIGAAPTPDVGPGPGAEPIWSVDAGSPAPAAAPDAGPDMGPGPDVGPAPEPVATDAPGPVWTGDGGAPGAGVEPSAESWRPDVWTAGALDGGDTGAFAGGAGGDAGDAGVLEGAAAGPSDGGNAVGLERSGTW